MPLSDTKCTNKTVNIQKVESFDFGKPVSSLDSSSDTIESLSSRINIENYSGAIDKNINDNLITSPQSLKYKIKPRFGPIQSKESPATILIFDAQKLNIIYRTNKFILQSINRPKMEKFQIVETFGDAHFFFFNERTKAYTFTGSMLDAFYAPEGDINHQFAAKYQWAQGFQDFYDNHFRGTQLSKNNQIAAIHVNEMVIKGYPIQLAINKDSTNFPDGVQFQMTWLIQEEILLQGTQARNLYDQRDFNSTLTEAWNDYYQAVNIYEQKKTNYKNLLIGPLESLESIEDISKAYGSIDSKINANAELTAAYTDVILASEKINSLANSQTQTSDWD